MLKPTARILAAAFGLVLAGTVLFGAAGTVAWLNGWLFVGLMSAVASLTAQAMKSSPGLAEERRSAAAAARPRDRAVVRLIRAAPIISVGLAIYDRRVGWFPPVPLPVSIAAFVFALGGAVLTYRAMSSNAFFSSYVRIQPDRGHVVVSRGPYRFVRHPGYAGSIVFNLLLPLLLGSWLALAPAVCVVALVVWRTAYDDRFLAGNLPGYGTYAARVHHRLIPGVW